MGYSPGDFNTRNDGTAHWELKDGPRIVLWSEGEMKQFVSFDGIENIKAMYTQLNTLCIMLDIV